MNSPELGAGVPDKKMPELTRERLSDMQTLGIELRADFGQTLEAVKQITGADLQPRPEGYHLTIIGPTESKVLSTLDDEALDELRKINGQVKKGEGVFLKGVGFIDGALSQYKMREVDKVKKTAFVALDIPTLQEFRAKIGLPPKDFHVTLGFVGGDIAMHIVGQTPIKPGSSKMKDVTALIPKEADPRFSDVPIPEITYGGLDGQTKQGK